MKCKACDAQLKDVKKNKRIFDPNDEENVLLEEEEDLCNTCWGIAKDCYLGYTLSAQDIETDIKQWFYGRNGGFTDDSGEIHHIYKTIDSQGYIGTEEL